MFDPLSLGMQLVGGTAKKLAGGANFKQAFSESLPIVGGIIGAGRRKEEAQLAQANAAEIANNKDANFGAKLGSNIPMAYGGELQPVTEFENGGTHEENPLGGIPQGVNSVEEGEVKVKLPDGDYVFSDRLIYNYAK